MKKNFTILFLLLSAVLISAQEYKDVSPDNLLINTKKVYPEQSKTTGISPYHTTPSWWFTRDRQIGGMAFGDYDGDGDLDLAVGCYYSNSYPPINEYENFILNNNNGILDTIPAWISTDERTTGEIKWADIDGDGRPDLVSANGNFAHSTIYFNSASGLSTSPGWISNDNVWTVGAALCDIDGNGWLDLAFGNQGLGSIPYKPIQIFFNNNGSLSTTPGWGSADEMITNSVSFTDLNKDNLTSATASYTANGTGNVYLLQKIPVYRIDSVKVGGTRTDNFCYDDINGWLSLGFMPAAGNYVDIFYTFVVKGDMAAVKWYGFLSGVYFNQNGLMDYLPGWTNGETGSQKGVAWADFNLDGYMDLAMGGSGMPAYIYQNNNGVLSGSPVWSSSSANTSCQELAAVDVNRDGYPDLAAVHFGNSRVEIFFNHGGILETEPSWTYTASSATAIAFGDVNGDGWLDLAVGTARDPIRLFIADPSLVPVEFTSFNSSANDGNVILKWSTATEKNNRGFEVERRDPGSSAWNSIAFIEGNGSSVQINNYSYTDKPLNSGKFSYRIKQIDFDGTVSYSRIVEMDFFNQLNFILKQNYPNPFNPVTKIEYTLPSDQFVSIKIYNILGDEISVIEEGFREKGNHTLFFDGENLNSGVYLYKMSSDNRSEIRKMVLLK